MPVVSVVVPVYKVEQYIFRCVDSILNQSYSDFQLILVDDGSPDNCPVICDDYSEKDNRVKVIHQENGGLSAARNTAIEYILNGSFTEWITFVDSDDWLHKDYLRLMINGANEFGTDIVCCLDTSVSEYVNDESFVDDPSAEKWDTETFFCNKRFDANAACARLFKTELLREIRFPSGRLHEDRFTSYKLYFQRKEVCAIQTPLYYYFVNEDSIVHTTWDIKRAEDDFLAARQQLDFFKIKGFDKSYNFILIQYVHLILYAIKQSKKLKQRWIHFKLKNKMYFTLAKYKNAYAIYDNKNDLKKNAFPLYYKISKKLRG